MVLSIKNKNKDNMLDFSFSKVAHFKATPCAGRLMPDCEHHITITFSPNSFGDFKQEINLEILKGLYKIPIALEGVCIGETSKTRTVRGPAAKVEDFKPMLRMIGEDEAANTLLQE
jgi:hypothetical protein